MTEIRQLDAATLKALAHPLRISLLDLLREGPATATGLAQRLGETSGATSYHLRQLNRAGLVEEDPNRGSKRERWWRPAQRGLRLRSSDLPDEPETRAAATAYVREVQRQRTALIERWHDEAMDWQPRWRDASMESDWTMRLTPEQLRALAWEVYEVVERHRPPEDADPEDGRAVSVQFYAFPQPSE